MDQEHRQIERQDPAREQFSSSLSIWAVTVPARAQRCRVRAKGRARTRESVSFFGPFFLGEGFPFALFDLTNKRRPGLCLRVEREMIGQFPAFRSKPKLDSTQVVIQFAAAEFRVARAENVHPMANIILRGVVKNDE